jgi:hypothetical protein
VQVRAAHARHLDPNYGVIALDQLGLGPLLDAHLTGRLKGHRLHGTGTV